MIGSTQPTIQSIETGRLPLSEAFAFALERATGISHQWLLENNPRRRPVTSTGKPWTPDCYPLAQEGGYEIAEEIHLIPRIRLLRFYCLARLVADELGYKGTVATNFNSILEKATLDLLGTISDKKLRVSIHEQAIEITLVPGNAGTLKMVLADARNLVRISREHSKRVAADNVRAAERAIKAQSRRQANRLDPARSE